MHKAKIMIILLAINIVITLCACSAGDRQSGTAVPTSESPAQTESAQQASTPETPSSTSPSIPLNNSPVQSNDGGDSGEQVLPDSVSGHVAISFGYVKQSGSASNQFAVWIEDMSGNYLQTVFATRWTANGGFNLTCEKSPGSVGGEMNRITYSPEC